MTQVSNRPQAPSTRIIYAVFDFVAEHRSRILNLIVAAIILTVLARGFHVVKKEEAGLVVRFGKVIEGHGSPGIHYHLPIVDRVHVRPVKRIATHRIASKGDEAASFTILSGDPTLFEIDVVLQYTIENLRDFMYVSTDPIAIATILTRAYLVNIVGQNFIDLIFTTNRGIIERHLRDEVSRDLVSFGIGMDLVAVSIVDVRPIDETVAAFRDVSDAVAESIQAVTNANSRKEKLILRTRGQAEAMVLAATARARERVVQARSSAEAFTDLLTAFREEPRQVSITRYWNRMRTIFAEANLAAVSPANSSTIDINMVQGILRRPPAAVAAETVSPVGAEREKPLVSTAMEATHGLEDSDSAQLDGQFHEGRKERDHLGSADTRSLIFDALSIFDHEDVVPGSRFGVQQVGEKSVVDQSATKAPAQQVPAETEEEVAGEPSKE